MKITAHDRPVSLHVMVFLNGKLCSRHIFSADEDRGEIVAYADSHERRFRLNPQTQEPETDILTGTVEIVLKPNAGPLIERLYAKMRKQR